MTPRLHILGVGNPMRGDDGVGHAVIEQLSPSEERVVCALTGEVSRLVEALGSAERVVLIDAMRSGTEPGTIACFDVSREPLPSSVIGAASTHALGVAEAVELARALGTLPEHVLVMGIEGAAFDAGASLSPPVEAAVARAVARIEDEDWSQEAAVHEHGLIADLMRKIDTIARAEGGTISVVRVRLGALSHISPEHFREHFVEAARGGVAEEAVLEIETSEDLDDPDAQDILLRSVDVEIPEVS